MHKYVSTMVFALVAVALVSFGQQLILRDNASSTTPVDEVRELENRTFGVYGILGAAEVATFTDPTIKGFLKTEVKLGASTNTLRFSYLNSVGSASYCELNLTKVP